MKHPTSRPLPKPKRRTSFADLVAAQDAGVSVPDSRAMTAGKHNITIEQVRQVEREGLDEEWPPL